LKSGERYLRVDTSIDCHSDHYYEFQYVVTFFIALYQLIPITWMLILYWHRSALMPTCINYDENLAMFIRDNNRSLGSFRFLFVDYKCNKYWFEVADMYRRIMFIGVVPLISHEPATRASFALLLSIISVVYFSHYQPYRLPFTNVIAFVAQVSILVTFYGALTIESESLINLGLEGQMLGIFLVVVNLIIILLALMFALDKYSQELELQRRISNMVQHVRKFL
jgi:hypothetical protein